MPSADQAARDIDALAKSALSQLEHSTAPEVTFALQTLNRRTALFVRQWGCHPTSESASLLDSAGTKLWNRTLAFADLEGGDVQAISILGLTRSVAALLIRAATADSTDVDDTSRLLLVLSKAISAMCRIANMTQEQQENTQELLSAAAERHESLRKTEGFQQSSSALEASQLFNLAKHEFARITGNTQVAEWALDVAVGEAESAHDRLSLASVHRTSKACVEYGSHLLVHVHRPQTSVIWLRRAIKLLERMEGGNLPQVTDLQAEALRKLARAFYQHALALPADEAQRSDALMSAEATLKELQRIYESIGSPLARDPRMTLLLLNIVGTRQGSMRRLLDLTKSLCGHEGPIDEHAVSCVLSLVRERSAQDIELLSELLDTLTEKLLQHTAEQADCIVRVLLTALTMCKNPATTTVAQSIIAKLERANYTVGKDGSFAAQMLLWKYADGRLQLAQPDRLLAATLYRMAAHPIFASADRNTAKSLRKATLCYLEAGDLTRAKETLYECPGHLADDALNHYLRFAILARSGREEEATAALEALMGAPNFTSSILPSVVKLAQDSGVQQALYHTLRSIAARAQTDSTLSSSVDLVVLTRCLIKQVLPGEIKHSMDTGTAKTLLSYFESNLHALQKEASRDVRDRRTCLEAQWSYKTAYNAAVALSSHIDPELTACFFDMALSLAKVREGLVAEPVESPDFQTTKVWAKLPAIVARAMGARDTERNIETPDRRIMWFKIKDETEEAFQLVTDAQVVAQSSELLKEVRWALVLLQYEAIVNLHDWVAATSCFELQAANGKVPLSILEAMTDLTWADPRAPDTLLCRLLQASIEGLKSRLNVSKGQGVQSQQSQDVARLARWIRALVSFTLSSKTTTARSAMVTNAQAELSTSVRETHLEALSQIEDAVAFLAEGRNDEPGAVLSDKTAATTLNANYPDDEKAWLVATAWDTGVELYHVGDFPLAKAFCEAALKLASLGAEDNAEFSVRQLKQMEIQYSRLLAQLEDGEQRD